MGHSCNATRCQADFGIPRKKGIRLLLLPLFIKLFCLDDEEAKDRIFQQHMDSQEDYDKAVEQLHNLEDCYDELLECGTITCREDLLRYGVTGWDAGRLTSWHVLAMT